jgi:hypothetical protein
VHALFGICEVRVSGWMAWLFVEQNTIMSLESLLLYHLDCQIVVYCAVLEGVVVLLFGVARSTCDSGEVV